MNQELGAPYKLVRSSVGEVLALLVKRPLFGFLEPCEKKAKHGCTYNFSAERLRQVHA